LEWRRWQEASVIESEVERWRTKARETAEGLMAQEIEAAISQAAKARCRELEAQCEAKCKDIEAAVEARVIAQAQAEFGRVYEELQARCKAESEAAVEARIDEAKAELRLEFGRARAEFEARCKAEAEARIAEVRIEARADAINHYTLLRIAKGVCPIPGTGMRALRAQIIIGPALIVDFERLMSPSLSVLLQKCSVVF